MRGTRNDFEHIADIVFDIRDPDIKRKVAYDLCAVLRDGNGLFKPCIFLTRAINGKLSREYADAKAEEADIRTRQKAVNAANIQSINGRSQSSGT